MKTLKVTLVILFCSLVSLTAQELASVLDAHFKAMSIEKMNKVETLITTGKSILSSAGIESPFVIYQSRPNLLRVEGTFQGSELIQTYDGKTGWTYAPALGMEEPIELKGKELETLLNQVQFESPLWNYAESGATLELAEPGGPGAYDHLILTSKEGVRGHYYLNRETHLLSFIRSVQPMGGSEAEIEVLFSDYKSVKGIPFAYSIVTKMNGQVVTTSLIDHVDVNRNIDPAMFEKPGVK